MVSPLKQRVDSNIVAPHPSSPQVTSVRLPQVPSYTAMMVSPTSIVSQVSISMLVSEATNEYQTVWWVSVGVLFH